jgi:hypothetical protein
MHLYMCVRVRVVCVPTLVEGYPNRLSWHCSRLPLTLIDLSMGKPGAGMCVLGSTAGTNKPRCVA